MKETKSFKHFLKIYVFLNSPIFRLPVKSRGQLVDYFPASKRENNPPISLLRWFLLFLFVSFCLSQLFRVFFVVLFFWASGFVYSRKPLIYSTVLLHPPQASFFFFLSFPLGLLDASGVPNSNWVHEQDSFCRSSVIFSRAFISSLMAIDSVICLNTYGNTC